MADRTGIEWTEATWNPTIGCSRVSPGCGGPGKAGGCYAERIAARFSGSGQPYHGFAHMVNGEARWTGKVALNEARLDQPLRWKRPRRIFVDSMSDLFHEALPDEVIDRVFAAMALCPQHTFQVLTKRAQRMRAYFDGWDAELDGDQARTTRAVNAALRAGRRNWGMCGSTSTAVTTRRGSGAREWQMLMQRGGQVQRLVGWRGDEEIWSTPSAEYVASLPEWHYHTEEFGWGWKLWPLPNVWLGVSVEDQARADERIPELLDTPAAVRFISAEPLLGPVDLTSIPFLSGDPRHKQDALRGEALLYGEGVNGYPDVTVRVNEPKLPRLDWVIAGGESGPGARPMHPDWARALRDQCQAAGVPFFFKQWGEWAPAPRDVFLHAGIRSAMLDTPRDGWDGCVWRVGKKAAGRLLDGREWNEFPAFARCASAGTPAVAERGEAKAG